MPAIEYVGEAPTKDGVYLVKATFIGKKEGTELVVAKASVYNGNVNWQQFGIDYDVWEHTFVGRYRIEVICRLDLDEIATGAELITGAEDKRQIIAVFDIWDGFQNSPLQWFAESIGSRMTDSVSLTLAEIVDSADVKQRVRGTT